MDRPLYRLTGIIMHVQLLPILRHDKSSDVIIPEPLTILLYKPFRSVGFISVFSKNYIESL